MVVSCASVMGHANSSISIKYLWVLGATGYVGKHVVFELLERFKDDPSTQIVAVGHQSIHEEIMERTHFLMMPLGEIVQKWLDKYPPSVVFHCARMAGSTDRKRFRAARKGEMANRRLKGLLEALPHPVKLVYCSGTLMYGNHTSAVLEGTEERPIAYARAYERAERPWKEGSSTMDISIAYPAWIFGPESWFEAFYLRPFKATGAVAQIGSGDAMMNLVHIRDVAGQLLHIALHGEPGERYNLYGGEAVRQGNFAEAVASTLGGEVRVMSEKELVNHYGKTIAEALTSSIPLGTKHGDWKARYSLKFPDWRTMVEDVAANYLRNS